MKWRMSGLGDRLGTTRKGVFKVFNSIRTLGTKDLNASSNAKEESIQLERLKPSSSQTDVSMRLKHKRLF